MALTRGLHVTNTTFEKNPRALVTLLSNDDRTKNQVDYILVKQRWRSSVLDVASTRHNTVLDSDHKMLLAKLKAYTKNVRHSNLDMASLQIPAVLNAYRDSLGSLFPTSLDDNIGTAWSSIRNAMSAAARRSLPKKVPVHKPWLPHESLALIAKRANSRSRKMLKNTRKAVEKNICADKIAYFSRLADEI